ncbi:hypothetical protein N431DRAFT_345662 [Stipitochalara longipes BDJ]|nr:hypothetical protein N431DRAFT_345662 [Stipitochalara longipes BDJ]
MTASIDPSSRTILGPLTTTFTAPATCTAAQRACSTCNYAWEAQTCYSGGAGGSETYGVKDATQCWPPTSAGLPEPTPPLWGWGFYSPGLICPTGYTSACSATAGSALTWTPEWSLAAGETAVGCCPSQYACTNNQPNVNTCQFVVSSTSVPVMTCHSGTTTDFSYLQVPFTVSNTAEPTFTLYAPLIQINWQSSDLLPSSSLSSVITPSSAGQSPSYNATPSAAKAGLPTGAIVGIAIGASLVALALTILLFLLRKKPNAKYGLAEQYSPTGLYELNGAGNKAAMGQSYPVSEISAEKEIPPAEIYSPPARDPRAELDAVGMRGYNGRSELGT